MSVKTTKAKELLERFSTSLRHTIAESHDLEKHRKAEEGRKMCKQTQENARNTAILMNALRVM